MPMPARLRSLRHGGRSWCTSGDLKEIEKMGIQIEMSLATIALAPPPVDSVVTVVRAPMEALNQLDAAVDFILPLSPTSPSKAGSRNPTPPLSPLLIQLRTVSKMTAYGERLGDDAMGVQGSRARLRECWRVGFGFVSYGRPWRPSTNWMQLWTLSCPSPPHLPARLARATLPHHSLPFCPTSYSL